MTWRERIAAARERGQFTLEDVTDAAQWTTCAVGEQHAQHPLVVRYEEDSEGGFPTDDVLYRLGGYWAAMDYGFLWAVSKNHFDRAEAVLGAIEDRVLELKRTKGETP